MHKLKGNQSKSNQEQQTYVAYIKSVNLRLGSINKHLQDTAAKLGDIIEQVEEAEEKMIASGIHPNSSTPHS